MTRFRLSILFVALLVGASLCLAQTTKNKGRGPKAEAKHVMVTPDQIKWGPPPPGLPPGSELAVLRGDPSKAGAPFTIRAKFPDGYKIQPHWHLTDENVSVMQGTLKIGMGNKFDESAASELPAGSYALMPKGVRHFAWARGETIIEIYGTGPFTITYVNPSDDPRHKAK